MTYAALLPELRDGWRLSNAQAGLVSGMFFAGYVGTVSLWTALTDRVDARKVYLAGSLVAALASAAFGALADGFAAAALCQALLGAGIAATYMPGLRLLSDRAGGPSQSRYVAFYTSFFGVGTALSYALAGFVSPAFGWRAAFLVSAAGPLLAGGAVYGLLAPLPARGGARRITFAGLLPVDAWRRVLANRAAAGYTAGYVVHCLELFGSRAWMVAYLGYCAARHEASFPWPAPAIAATVNLLAVPASILGNEIALRIGRRPWILLVMLASGSAGILLALVAGRHWTIVLALLTAYSMLVMAESGTLTAGLIAATPAELRGAAMGLYSLAGFGGGLLGPVLFGAALDGAGGTEHRLAWLAGYAAIGAGCLAAPFVARIARGRAAS